MSKEVTTRGAGGALRAQSPARRRASPPVDVFENADEVLIVADVPGVPTEAIDVRVENDTLTLEAARRSGDESPALAREYEELSFARAFRIPAGIDAANIDAQARHGTVVVRLPKTVAAKPRRIDVK